MMILLAYMKYVLRLEFSGSYAEMLPALFLGSMIGVTMGMFITSIGKMGEGMKVGVMVGVSMAMSFCAGLMNADIKNIIDRSAPLLNRINPAALISDALYCINNIQADHGLRKAAKQAIKNVLGEDTVRSIRSIIKK